MKNVKNQKTQDRTLNCMKKTQARSPFIHYKISASVKFGLDSYFRASSMLSVFWIWPASMSPLKVLRNPGSPQNTGLKRNCV